MSDSSPYSATDDSQSRSDETRSGRRTVMAMFAFGVLMVSMLWLYWEMYTRPFRPLQNAIAAAYPGTRPNVVGGRHKSHKQGSPETLRIVLQMPMSDFDPEVAIDKSEERALHLVRLADENLQLSDYEQVEVHLVQRPPEQAQRLRTISHSVKEWRKLLEADR